MIDCSVFYAVSVVLQPCNRNSGRNRGAIIVKYKDTLGCICKYGEPGGGGVSKGMNTIPTVCGAFKVEKVDSLYQGSKIDLLNWPENPQFI